LSLPRNTFCLVAAWSRRRKCCARLIGCGVSARASAHDSVSTRLIRSAVVIVVDNSGFVVANRDGGVRVHIWTGWADSWHGKASPTSVGIQGRVIGPKC